VAIQDLRDDRLVGQDIPPLQDGAIDDVHLLHP
jgi:hypothetical protein